LSVLTEQTTGRPQRRPEEKRARLLAAARTAFSATGYGASVHEICQAASVGIGTFYHQFPDKSDLMRFLMDEEHQYRVRAFDALAVRGAEDLSAEVARIISGSDPGLLRAMIEACRKGPFAARVTEVLVSDGAEHFRTQAELDAHIAKRQQDMRVAAAPITPATNPKFAVKPSLNP